MYNIIKGGRFGNNIIQLINCIDLALQSGVHDIHHNFNFLSNTSIIIEENKIIKCERHSCQYKIHNNNKVSSTHCCQRCAQNGIHGPCCQKISIPILSSAFKNKEDMIALYKNYDDSNKNSYLILTRYIKPILIYDIDTEYVSLYKNSLFIHIRSGDIFKNNRVSPHYAQPPLDYYIKIFELENDKRKFIFIEDDKNPVVNKLKGLYPDIIFACVSVEKLIGIFMNAEYVVSGNGTFISSILLFNNKLKLHYTAGAGGESGGGIPFLYNNITKQYPKTILAKFPKYINIWKNTPKQRNLMIEYNNTIIQS